jgi:pilus assembly protein CpaD
MSRVSLMTEQKSRTLLMAALAISVSSLAGCGLFKDRHSIEVGSVPDDYRTNHPIVLSEQEETLDVPVGTSDTQISIPQRDSIRGFMSQYALNGSGIVQILLPTGSPNAAAAHRVQGQIIATLRKSGVAGANIVTASYDASSSTASAPVRLSYRAMSAATEPCGKWSEDLGDTQQNKHWANFGCSSQNNLAAMVANPADLIGPRLPSGVDPVKRGLAMSKYQKSTGAWSENTDYTW